MSVYFEMLSELFGEKLLLFNLNENEKINEYAAALKQMTEDITAIKKKTGIAADAWLNRRQLTSNASGLKDIITGRCEKLAETDETAARIVKNSDFLSERSVWIMCKAEEKEQMSAGLGGISEIIPDINFLVIYGPKDCEAGRTDKQDALLSVYPEKVFAAQIAAGFDPAHAKNTLTEAARFKGISVTAAFDPCAEETLPTDLLRKETARAVSEGLWPKTGSSNPAAPVQPLRFKGTEKWAPVSRSLFAHEPGEQKPSERVNNFDEIYNDYTPAEAIREAKRCFRCKKRPCMKNGCPVHNRIPDFIESVAKGRFEDAYEILSETTCLPAVCGRVCQQSKQCEGSCVRGIKGEAVAIGNLERFVADYHRQNAAGTVLKANESGTEKAYKAAIIGSGPSGLSCASFLADNGINVSVFDREEKPGGVLWYGIPQFRLPYGIVSDEVENLKKKGVVFISSESEETLDIEQLMDAEGFNAVYIANGAGIPNRMNIPGENLPDVISASDFLKNINTEPEGQNVLKYRKYRKIAVVGGGNVAMDACRAAVRMGAEKVYVIYRRSEADMPADKKELKEACEEGVEFVFLTNPKKIIGAEGRVTGVECVKMALSDAGGDGRNNVEAIAGSEFIIDTDAVVMALGSGFDKTLFGTGKKPERTEKGAVIVNSKHMTSLAGVFAGGDTVTGPASVVKAMGAGREAGMAITDFLNSFGQEDSKFSK